MDQLFERKFSSALSGVDVTMKELSPQNQHQQHQQQQQQQSSLIIASVIKNEENPEVLNNNNKNDICCKDIINGCHSSNNGSSIESHNLYENSKSHQSSKSIAEDDNTIPTKSLHCSKVPEKSQSTSNESIADSLSNISTENISDMSDNDAVEEIVSDDELSRNSDNCIYTYRGGDSDMLNDGNHLAGGSQDIPNIFINERQGLQNQQQQNQHQQQQMQQNQLQQEQNAIGVDDDFLEMDFEPDPSSELEQNNANFSIDLFNNIISRALSAEQIPQNELNSEIFKIIDPEILKPSTSSAITEEIAKNSEYIQSVCNQNFGSDDDSVNNDDDNDETEGNSSNSPNDIVLLEEQLHRDRFRRVAPKIYVQHNALLESDIEYNCLRNEFNMRRNNPSNYDTKNFLNFEICSDCLEREYLYRSIGNYKPNERILCPRCKSNNGVYIKKHYPNKKRYTSSTSTSSHYFKTEAEFEKYFEKNNIIIGNNPSEMRYHFRLLNLDQEYEQSDDKSHEESVKFLSVNVDKDTIVQALKKIKVDYNEDILSEYFNSFPNEIQAITDIHDLIVYMSKKDCDSKRIIKLIETICKDKVKIKFYLPDMESKDNFEIDTVQINVNEIIHRWHSKCDLRRLETLDKRFKQLNVLGKVINIIRQSHQRRIKPIEEFIEIPQYYEIGYICITKISSSLPISKEN